MGYGKINLYGGSYGSRAALVYLRRHPRHARAAVLRGIVPLAWTSPLYHAQSAQRAIDLIFEECASEDDCATAFAGIDQEFQTVLERLEAAPAQVTVEHPDTGEPVTVELTRAAFAEGMRLLMYLTARTRHLWGLAVVGDQDGAASHPGRSEHQQESVTTLMRSRPRCSNGVRQSLRTCRHRTASSECLRRRSAAVACRPAVD